MRIDRVWFAAYSAINYCTCCAIPLIALKSVNVAVETEWGAIMQVANASSTQIPDATEPPTPQSTVPLASRGGMTVTFDPSHVRQT